MINKGDKIPAQPLFSKGCLTYKDSGHTLVKNGEYYRCSLKANGFCREESEQLISVKNFNERFERLIDRFTLPEGEGLKMFNKLMATFLEYGLKIGTQNSYCEEMFQSHGNSMIDDIGHGKRILKSDIISFRKFYMDWLKQVYGESLLTLMLDVVFVLSKTDEEVGAMESFIKTSLKITKKRERRSFAMQLKKIYISDDGNIENVEFEGWGWYVIQYLKRNVHWYLNDFPSSFIKNTIQFGSATFFEALDEFKENGFRDAYSYGAYGSAYAEKKMENKIFGGFEKLEPKEQIAYLKSLNGITPQMVYSYFASVFRL